MKPNFELINVLAKSIIVRNIRTGSVITHTINSIRNITTYSLRENGDNLLIYYTVSSLACGPFYILICGDVIQLDIYDSQECINIDSFDSNKICITCDGEVFDDKTNQSSNHLFIKNVGNSEFIVEVKDEKEMNRITLGPGAEL